MATPPRQWRRRLPPQPVRSSNVENAVIGHGELEGKFTETDDVAIERDPNFPVRVTVQFYKATDNGVVSQADLKAIKTQINRVYSRSAYVGSLVTGGQTGRITEYQGVKVQPVNWWATVLEASREKHRRFARNRPRQIAQIAG